jgi:hypothetical protein
VYLHVVEMDDEEFCVPDDVLEEASAAKFQMVPTKSKLRYQKELEIFTQWQTEKRIKGKDESSISAVVIFNVEEYCCATFDRGLAQAEKVGVRGVGLIKFICVLVEHSAFIKKKNKRKKVILNKVN